VRRLSISARLLIAGLIAAAAAFAVWVIPTDSYIFLPNEAHAVAPLVEVEGGDDPKDGGGVYYVDVLVRKATLLERVWPGLEDGATVVPAAEVRPPGVSEGERRREELAEMRMSQRVAAAVALRELGYDVAAKPTGARIELVDPESPAAGKLRSGDIVIGAGGKPVTAPAGLRRAIRAAGSGNEVSIVAKRGTENVRLQVRPTQGPEGTPVIGVIVSQAADIKLPLDVEIDTGGVGGPSAGLAFALALMEELGHDVDRGNRIAVTGSLELDGTVGQIGGVKQKTVGVERADIDVFLVPAGENATEARRNADGIKVIPVRTFQQALRALKTLPQKSQD
jgi:PDZ domain-containing protein